MTEVENLTYLVGTPEDRCQLLHCIDDKEKLIELFNQFKTHEKFKSKAYLFLILNPNRPVGVVDHEEISDYIQSLSESELDLITAYIQQNKTVVNNESLKILVDVVGDCLVQQYPVKSNFSVGIYQPYFIQNKGPLSRMNLLKKITQYPHADPKIFGTLEDILMSTKSGFVKSVLSYLLKVSANPKFLEFYLTKLKNSKNPKFEDYSLNHFVVNPHLTAGLIEEMESSFKLKPKQKRLLLAHPNRAS